MSFRTLRLFCEVADCGSFSKAADQQGISQSSVSQAVAQLERQLGLELIDRSHRPLAMTPAGKKYLEGCRELLAGFDQLEADVRQLAGHVTGRLRVAAIYSIGLLQMDSYVHAFEQVFPDVDLRVDYAHPKDVYEQVRTEKSDIGLISFTEKAGDITSIPWQQQQFSLIVYPHHRLAKLATGDYDSVPVEAIQGEDYVNFTSELRVRSQLNRWLREAGVSPNTVHEFDNVEQIRRAVEDGVGIALLPEATVKRSVETGTLVSLNLENAEWARPLNIIHKRNGRLSHAADRFVNLLQEGLEPWRKSQQSSDDGRTGSRDQKLQAST